MRSSRSLWSAAVLASAVLGAGCVTPILESLEEPLIFRPRTLDLREAKALASGNHIEEVRVATTEGVTLHGWLKRPDDWHPGERHRLVIIYGGVGQEVSEFARRAHASGPWGWLMINYRGFGLSGGSPSERTVLGDAKRIYDWAATRPDIDTANIVVLGRSLGSYVAIAVAAARKVRAAILATPFDSAAALGEEHFHWLPLPFARLMQSRYNPGLIAPLVTVPALFLLAEKDDVTPVKNGLALARRWGGTVKTVLLPGIGHSGVERHDEFWDSIAQFLATLDNPPPPALAMSPSAAAPSTNK
ncbi:MAG: alpha/beta hydrolase [Burkholderiales bacterium]